MALSWCAVDDLPTQYVCVLLSMFGGKVYRTAPSRMVTPQWFMAKVPYTCRFQVCFFNVHRRNGLAWNNASPTRYRGPCWLPSQD
jgi:hypothetical protein